MIVVPMYEEMKYIFQTLSETGRFHDNLSPQQRRYRYTYARRAANLTVVDFIVQETQGNLACLSSVVTSIREAEPQLIILAGIAGSLDHDRVKLGDVVISDRVKFFQPDKIRQRGADEEFVADPLSEIEKARASGIAADKIFVDSRKRYLSDSFFRYRRDAIIWNPSASLFQNLRMDAEYIDFNLAPFSNSHDALNRKPSVHFGAVLGCDWVVDSLEFIEFVTARNENREADVYTQKFGSENNERSEWIEDELLSVDTESYGFFRGLCDVQNKNSGSMALVVRGISDMASIKEEHDVVTGGEARSIAARNSVRAALAILDRIQSQMAG